VAKLSFDIQSNIGNLTVDGPTLTDAQMQRFLDYIWTAYPQLNADGSPKTKNAANLANSYRAWANGIWQGTVNNVLSFEQQNAAVTASAAVQPIA
jgi:hypothetical protein